LTHTGGIVEGQGGTTKPLTKMAKRQQRTTLRPEKFTLHRDILMLQPEGVTLYTKGRTLQGKGITLHLQTNIWHRSQEPISRKAKWRLYYILQ